MQTNPFSGEQHGQHTPAAAARLIDYLKATTGETFRLHGSVAKGRTSSNDLDLSWIDPTTGMTEEELQDWSADLNATMADAEAEAWAKHQAGDSSALAALYESSPSDSVLEALVPFGFRHVSDVEWLGIGVTRYENPETGHAVEVWFPTGNDSYDL